MTWRGLHTTLDPLNDLVVVGEADGGETAIERARELTPNVVFMDARVPGIGGIEATKAIRQASAETRMILLRMTSRAPRSRRRSGPGSRATC